MYAAQQRPLSSNIFQVDGRKYAEERVLGQGTFGEVYKVKEAGGSGGVYALKKIKVKNDKAVIMVNREIDILKTCNHDHIVRLCGTEDTKSQIHGARFFLILMEYCEGGNLNSRLARPSDNGTNLRWMKELADAMNYLHSRNVVHRDLKPENVLLTGNDSIKLGDFGLAREFAVLRQSHATRSDEVLVSYLNQVYMGSYLGTRAWMAPEVFKEHYTEKADIFSLGAIFYSIVKRKVKSDDSKYFGAFVNIRGEETSLGMAMRRNPDVMVSMDGVPPSAGKLLHDMLHYDPKKRPNAIQVLERVTAISL